MPQSLTRLYAHLIFSTKNRETCLEGQDGEACLLAEGHIHPLPLVRHGRPRNSSEARLIFESTHHSTVF